MPRPPLPPGTNGKINARKLNSGRWRASCRYRDATGSMFIPQRDGATKAAAENRLREALRDVYGMRTGGEITSATRVAELVEGYLEEVAADSAPNTVRLYASHARNHVLPALGQLAVGEVTVGRVDDFLRGMRERGYGADAARVSRAVANGLLSRALRFGAIETNPVEGTRRIKSTKRRVRSLSLAERVDLVRKLDEREARTRPGYDDTDLPDLTRLMLGTGLRIAEALALSWAEVDLETEPATVTGGFNLVRIAGRGIVRQGEDGEESTKARQRTIPIPDFLLLVLRGRRIGVGDPGMPVFPMLRGARRGHGWRDPTNVGNAFRKALDGIDYSWVSSHHFRKTAATVWHEAGLVDRDVAALTGHSRIATLQDDYLGELRTVHPTAAKLLDRAMFDQ